MSRDPGIKDRACLACGKKFRGTNLYCGTCQKIERECLACGKLFRGKTLKCYACRATERECSRCGNTFRGHTHECYECRSAEHECADCGRMFKGSHRNCISCRSIERECLACGKTFRGHKRQCNSCRTAAQDPGRRCALGRKKRNARRARKKAAEVAGPVPASVYQEILSSGPCVYCRATAEQVDHIRPLAWGGHEAEYNLVPACGACNNSKGSKLLTKWDQARVAHAVAVSPKVAAEWERLTKRRRTTAVTRSLSTG